MSKVTSIACAVLLTAIAGACGKDDPITAFDRNTDCVAICDKFKECFSDSDYNEDECADECSDMVNEDDTAKIDNCEECIDGASCGETVGCTTECAGLVPIAT